MTSSPSSTSTAQALHEYGFLELSQADCVQLQPFLSFLQMERGELLFATGERARAAYFLLSGEVALRCKGVVFQQLKRGDAFGQASLLLTHRRLSDAIALESCQLAALTHAGLLKLRAHHPGLAARVLAQIQLTLTRVSLQTLQDVLRVEND